MGDYVNGTVQRRRVRGVAGACARGFPQSGIEKSFVVIVSRRKDEDDDEKDDESLCFSERCMRQ